MTDPGQNQPHPRFALLASGASFSCEVLAALQRERYRPELLILPEYPPAVKFVQPQILAPTPVRRLLEQAQGIETGYAPVARQSSCARLIRQHAIDFLLVACWPYLIDKVLIDSVLKAALNLHPSLLPDYRGPNPLEQQIRQSNPRFGVTLHLLNQRFDRGDIVAQSELIELEQNPDRLYLERRNALLGTQLFIEAVNSYGRGWNPVPQP